MQKFDVRIHNGFETISAQWPDGVSNAAPDIGYHVFQILPFLTLSWETFGVPSRALLCMTEVYGEDGRPLIFIPFCLRRRRGARILSFLDFEVADYNAPILFPSPFTWTKELAAELYDAIRHALPRHDFVKLEKMPAMVGNALNPLHMLADGADVVSCHGNDLKKPWEEIERSIPWRKTLLKKMRALERVAPVTFSVVESDAERSLLMGKLVEQKQRRFEETKVPGFDADPAKKRFFLEGADVFNEIGVLRLCCLRVGDDIVATLFGLARGGHYYALMIGSDGGRWASYSVGRILYYRMLAWLHSNNYAIMDLGVGDEPWKIDHADVTIALARKTEIVAWRGSVFHGAAKLMEILRATPAWQKIRPLKWVVLRALQSKAQTRTEELPKKSELS